MKKLLRFAAVVVTGLSLSTGIAAAQTGSVSMSFTGPDSTNKVKSSNDVNTKVNNKNVLGVTNNNPQKASSGDASVKHNTTGGDATSGNAKNDGMLDVSGTIDNTGGACGCQSAGASVDPSSVTFDHTGPDSSNKVETTNKVKTTINNDNYINVVNNNKQSAYTGDASVKDNTTGGNATSGDASNVSTTKVDLSLMN